MVLELICCDTKLMKVYHLWGGDLLIKFLIDPFPRMFDLALPQSTVSCNLVTKGGGWWS